MFQTFREKKSIVNERTVRILSSKIIFIFYKIGRSNILDEYNNLLIIIYNNLIYLLDNIDKLCSKYIR